jgi:salicylate hydroxylase
MAIEDGCVLARCLERDRDPATALQRYEGLRMGRTAKAVRGSSEMQYTFHNPALAQPRTAEPYVEETWSPQRSRARYDWIYEYDATKAPLEGAAEGAG